MSFFCPQKYITKVENVNETMKALKGDLDEKTAKITLAKFLRANLGFTVFLLTGIRLEKFQEIILKGYFNRNFCMSIMCRGSGKSFLASVYCVLQCLFEPNTRIICVAQNFRTSRAIFNEIEKMSKSKGAELLSQALATGRMERRPDIYTWDINGGFIKCVPVCGEKIRGMRCDILVIDEAALMPKALIDDVLTPFLASPHDLKQRIKVRRLEDKLIKSGQMEEKDRMVFENKSKMILLSSASYTFENLYDMFSKWKYNIEQEEDTSKHDAKYFLYQMSWEALPDYMIDPIAREQAQNGGSSHASYLREWCGQFTDGSEGYFSAKKMLECTIPNGELPTTLLVGKKDRKYILAIDPSFSNSPTSDNFAMSVLELNNDGTSTLVHSYAVAGGDLKNHIKYFHYVYISFNIQLIVIDNAGWEFIESANGSELFRKSKIELKFFEFDNNKEGVEYAQELMAAKAKYNKETHTICIKQYFNSDWLRKSNEHLQACIDHKKIFFASPLQGEEDVLNAQISQPIDVEKLNHPRISKIFDLVEEQDALIPQTKTELALIEVKSSTLGVQTYDIPQHLRRSKSPNRARKDSYTALLLANWGAKCYLDLMYTQVENVAATFTPRMINWRGAK